MIIFPSAPTRNGDVCAVYYDLAFSDDDCNRIVAAIDDSLWEEGQVGEADYSGGFVVDRKIRACWQQPLPVDAGGSPLTLLMAEIVKANARKWNFKLAGIVADDLPWVMRYPADMGGHNDWHVDIGRRTSASRKLGFSLQLSNSDAYRGGDLEFHEIDVEPARLRQRGTMIVFPAYWLHRVAPVTDGERLAVVGWVHGPSYR